MIFKEPEHNPRDKTITESPESEESETSCTCKAKVLIVDQNEVNNYSIKCMFQTLGIHSDSALNGNDAVQMFIDSLQKFCCDLRYTMVMIDMDSLTMDGYEIAEKMHQHEDLLR